MTPTYRLTIIVLSALFSLATGVILVNMNFVAISELLVLFLLLTRVTSNVPHTSVLLTFTPNEIVVYENETFTTTLLVKNYGPQLSQLEIFYHVPPDILKMSESNILFVNIPATGQITQSLVFTARTLGVYRIGPIRISSFDTFRFFAESDEKYVYLTVKVFPKLQYPKELVIKPKITKNWPGETVTRKVGLGMEFFSIREYIPGDQIKRINWKASARSGKLMANQYMSELGGDVVIAVDLRNQAVISLNGESTDIYSRRAAGTLSYKLLRDRNRVGMIILGENLVKIPPGFGKRQLDRILSALISTETGGVWEIENLQKFISLFFPKLVYIIAISPLTDHKSYNAILAIALKGYPVLLISPSPLPKSVSANSHYEEIGKKLLAVERTLKLNSLRKYMTVIDWDTERRLSEVVQAELIERRVRTL
jgi:uncharacterized protein (DUF58 family)